MQCTSPISGYRAIQGGGIKTSLKETYHDCLLTVRCGQCMGCRIERSRVWGIRCLHEASLYEENCFVTLTYSDEELPYGETLNKKHMQDFFKRLKKRHPSQKIRQYYCGEYGDETNRPHYHALIFNYRPNDGVPLKKSGEYTLYSSEKLSKTWGHGHANFGDVTFESAQYVAGYVTKKITGDQAKEHYEWINEDTGEIVDRLPEFGQPSLRPGIGYNWIEKWLYDVYPRDEIIINGQRTRPPRYYDQVLEALDPQLYRKVMNKRGIEQHAHWEKGEFADVNTGKLKSVLKSKDEDKYVGSDRHLLAKAKIIQSRQRARKEQ